METALLRCRPRTPETPAASRPRGKRSQQNQYLVPGYLWRVSNLKLLAVAVQRMKSAHLQDVSPLFLPLGLNGTVSKTGKGTVRRAGDCSALARCLLGRQALAKGALDLPPKFSSILWWHGRKDQTIQFKESSTQTKSWFRIFSPWMFTNILLFTLLFPPLCVTVYHSQSTF